jgi:predicted mannosyl-3-phosphoglycerate phosphatase (HAD superfamily)
MSQRLTKDEVAVIIHARKILKNQGLEKNADVKTLCREAGISRKTGYQHANKLMESSDSQEHDLRKELEQLRNEHEELKKRFERERFENEGRKLAWEIHGVDKFLAEKKSTMTKRTRKKR